MKVDQLFPNKKKPTLKKQQQKKDQRIKPGSPALQADASSSEPPGKP